MGNPLDQREDVHLLRVRQDRAGRERRRDAERDVVIMNERRLILQSPNGHFWEIAVDDTGAVVGVDLGASLP